MIRYLSGTARALTHDSLIIDVNGIGYLVATTPETLLSISEGQTVSLHTHLAVRETALDLYGFSSPATLNLFELLLTVSGIGPKTALSVLAQSGSEALTTAIRENNPTYLVKVAGMGKKTAEKIVHELKDKAILLGGALESTTQDTETIEALQSMGYTLSEARTATKSVPVAITDHASRLKEALRSLAR